MSAERYSIFGLRFDGTINAGHIVTALAVIASVLIAWVRMDDRIAAVDTRVSAEIEMRTQAETYAGDQIKELRSDIGTLNATIRELLQAQRRGQ